MTVTDSQPKTEPEPTPAPPAKPAPKPKTGKGPGRPSKDDQLQQQLAETLAALSMIGMAASASVTGKTGPGSVAQDFVIVMDQSDALATALVNIAKRNPKVRKTLEAMVTTSAYGEVATVVFGGILVPIMANHGLMPTTIGGQPPATEGEPEGDAQAA